MNIIDLTAIIILGKLGIPSIGFLSCSFLTNFNRTHTNSDTPAIEVGNQFSRVQAEPELVLMGLKITWLMEYMIGIMSAVNHLTGTNSLLSLNHCYRYFVYGSPNSSPKP